MKVTSDMTINAVLDLDEEKMLRTLAWLAPDLGRLQSPNPRRAVIGLVSVEQAARIAQVPLTEMLFVLNIAAGEREGDMSMELRSTEVEIQQTNRLAKAKPA